MDSVKTIVDFHVTPSQNSSEIIINVPDALTIPKLEERLFDPLTLEIWTGSGSSGVLLVQDTDYAIDNLSLYARQETGVSIYSQIKIINATYQNVNLYIPITSLDQYGDIIRASDINILNTNQQQIIQNSQQITSNYNVVNTLPQNRFLNVTTGASNIVITFDSASVDALPSRVGIMKDDSGTGLLNIIGVKGGSRYLIQNKILFIEIQETSTGVYEWIVVQQANLIDKYFQNDFPNGDIYDGSGELWELSGPAIISQNNNLPEIVYNGLERNGNSGFGKIFANRGCYYFDSSKDNYLSLPNQLQNEDSIEFWIFPNWGASPGSNQTIIDSRQGTINNDYVFLYYINATNAYELYIQNTSGNSLRITGSIIADPNALTHIKISWSKSGNTSKLIVDGIDQGSPTITGSGITNINLLGNSGITIGSINDDLTPAPNSVMTSWLTDFIVHGSYDISTSHFTSGKPYITQNRSMGKDTHFWIDEYGNLGSKNGFFDKLFKNNLSVETKTSFIKANDDVTIKGPNPVHLTFTKATTDKVISLEDIKENDGQEITIKVVDSNTGIPVLDTLNGATVDGDTVDGNPLNTDWKWNGNGTLTLKLNWNNGINPNYEVIGNGIWDSGSNSNGKFEKYTSDVMRCWNKIELTYASTTTMTGTWTFPIEFNSLPEHIDHCITQKGENLTPSFDSLGAMYVGSEQTDDVNLILRRVPGATNFGVSDTVDTYATAIGVWR